MTDLILRVLDHFGLEYVDEGAQVKLRCPFHEERTASLGIIESGMWHCFGCRKGGQFVEFVAALQGKGVLEAYVLLSKLRNGNGGVHVGPITCDEERPRKRPMEPKDVLAAWKRFHPVVWSVMADAHPVVRYLVGKRGFKRKTLDDFDVRLTEQADYPVVFPIMRTGELLGYVKRRIGGEGERKYLYNSGFSAATSLAYHHVEPDQLLIVEGILDFMKAVQFGCRHVAAILSWHITDEQGAWLEKRGVRDVVCGLDNTPTGVEGYRRLKEFRFRVQRLRYPGYHIKDVGDMDVAQFWQAWPIRGEASARG